MNGILTANMKRRAPTVRVRLKDDPEVIQVPLWKAILVTVALCAMSATYAYSVQPEPQVVTKIKMVPVDHPVPACKPTHSLTSLKNYKGMQAQIAAAIPASALGRR